MADDEEVTINDDGSVSEKLPSVNFMPSVFEQAREYQEEQSLEASSGSSESTKTKVEPIEFDIDDVRDAAAMPFDLARIITKHKGFTLTPEEQERLGRRWLRPFQQYFGTVKGMGVYMALAATITIATDKTLDYLEAKERKENESK